MDFPVGMGGTSIQTALKAMSSAGRSAIVVFEQNTAYLLPVHRVINAADDRLDTLGDIPRDTFDIVDAVLSGVNALVTGREFMAYSLKPDLCACDKCQDVYPSKRSGDPCDKADGGTITCP